MGSSYKQMQIKLKKSNAQYNQWLISDGLQAHKAESSKQESKELQEPEAQEFEKQQFEQSHRENNIVHIAQKPAEQAKGQEKPSDHQKKSSVTFPGKGDDDSFYYQRKPGSFTPSDQSPIEVPTMGRKRR